MTEYVWSPDRTSMIDPLALETSLAMFSSPGSLAGKLQAIWQGTQRLILKAEGTYGSKLSKAWGANAKTAMKDSDLLARAELAVKEKLPRRSQSDRGEVPEDGLVATYFGALRELRNAQLRFQTAQAAEVGKSSAAGTYDASQFNLEIWHPEHLKLSRYLDDVVPCFFALQLHCYRLVRMLESPAGVPPDPIARTRRAMAGSKASLKGEDIFKGMVAEYLRTIAPGTKYSSVNALFEAHFEGLRGVLETYLKHQHKAVRNRESMPYGPDLTAEGNKKRLGDWAKKDPEGFGRLLDSLLLKPRRAP